MTEYKRFEKITPEDLTQFPVWLSGRFDEDAPDESHSRGLTVDEYLALKGNISDYHVVARMELADGAEVIGLVEAEGLKVPDPARSARPAAVTPDGHVPFVLGALSAVDNERMLDILQPLHRAPEAVFPIKCHLDPPFGSGALEASWAFSIEGFYYLAADDGYKAKCVKPTSPNKS